MPPRPLIDVASRRNESLVRRIVGAALVAAVVAVTFRPALENGFLSIAFDDAIVLDSASIRGLDRPHLWAMASEFNHAHWVPLTMLSLAIDHHIWGLDPRGYHLTNLLLHAAAAVLAFLFACRIAPSLPAALLAALVFAVHPLQMEAVSLAIQRKTLLSAALFFAAFLFYQRWRDSDRAASYALALLLFVAAGLAKPIVVALPLLLVLYDVTFVDGRIRVRDKLPFAAVAAVVAVAAAAAHAAVGATHPPHGGSIASHVLIVARATAESLAAVFAPVNLSPIYYYHPGSAFSPLNGLALAALLGGGAFVLVRRRERPWTFFCFAWFALALLPESNLFPLAQLRADRFLYLPLFGPALWVGVGADRLAAGGGVRRAAAGLAGVALVAGLAATTRSSAGIWRSDVSAWTRIVQRHPWSVTARTFLGVAHREAGDTAAAEQAFLDAIHRRPEFPRPHLELARLYHGAGNDRRAARRLRTFLELAPEDAEGRALLASLRPQDGSDGGAPETQ